MTLKSEVLVAVQAGLAVRPDSVPTVSTINVPILSIAGGEDLAVSSAEMEAFRAAREPVSPFSFRRQAISRPMSNPRT